MSGIHVSSGPVFQRLPSPSALRTFEAAARHRSFKKAAEELGVTPTAVSHQIRALERTLDTTLFVRRTRAVDLTAAGSALAPAVHEGLLRIRAAIEEIAAVERELTVTTTAAFAALRLVPRLADFERLNPDTRVRLSTGAQPVDLRRDRRVDVAIRYAPEPSPDLHERLLIEERFGAYGAPGRFEAAAGVGGLPLLETEWQRPLPAAVTWRTWLARAGEPVPAAGLRITRYGEEHFVLQAALAGQGVALLSDALVGDVVAQGLLVPWRPEVTVGGGRYVALSTRDRAAARHVRRFLDWLEAEFARP